MAKGLRDGVNCPHCKQGKLEYVMRSVSAGRTTSGVIGMALSKSIIDHLACSECFLMFMAEYRGETLKDVMEMQLEGFQNPEHKPDTCPSCTKELTTEHSESYAGVPGRPKYLYCDSCRKVHWVHTRAERHPEIQELSAKLKSVRRE